MQEDTSRKVIDLNPGAGKKILIKKSLLKCTHLIILLRNLYSKHVRDIKSINCLLFIWGKCTPNSNLKNVFLRKKDTRKHRECSFGKVDQTGQEKFRIYYFGELGRFI